MKTRIISAIVAIAIAVPFIYLGGIPYAFAIGVLAVLAFKEIYDLKKSHKEIPFISAAIAIFAMLLLIYTNFDGSSIIHGVTYMRVIFLVGGLLIPSLFIKNYSTSDAFYLIGSTLFLGIAFNSFILVRDRGINLFLYLILVPLLTDAFAYFIGKFMGKHKLCPSISPNKTWEGAIGGLICGTAIPYIFYIFLINGGQIDISVIFGTAFLSILGQIGDLLFSKIKRENGIKDFSNIMPGHGGVLDRLDSTIIVFMAYIYITRILF